MFHERITQNQYKYPKTVEMISNVARNFERTSVTSFFNLNFIFFEWISFWKVPNLRIVKNDDNAYFVEQEEEYAARNK